MLILNKIDQTEFPILETLYFQVRILKANKTEVVVFFSLIIYRFLLTYFTVCPCKIFDKTDKHFISGAVSASGGWEPDTVSGLLVWWGELQAMDAEVIISQ